MSLPYPLRGHNVINNGVKDIYRNVIKRYFDTVIYIYIYIYIYNIRLYVYKRISITISINKVEKGGLPADCILWTAPLPHETKIKIRESAVYVPEKEIYRNHRKAERFGRANKNV